MSSHRLSTITHADQILVMKNGIIAERGTHDGLLLKNGTYASMWNKQAKAEKAAEDARNATRKAERYLRRVSDLSGPDDDSSSSDESARNTAPPRSAN